MSDNKEKKKVSLWKKALVVILSLIILLFIALGIKWLVGMVENRSRPDPTIGLEGTRGNTVSNLAHGGEVAETDDWLFMATSPDSFSTSRLNEGEKILDVDLSLLPPTNIGIYRISKVTGTCEQISKDVGTYFNIMGEWLYYINTMDGNIYKIDFDGNQRTKVVDEDAHIFSMSILDGWIYYAVGPYGDYGSSINKVRIDGYKTTQLLHEATDSNPANINSILGEGDELTVNIVYLNDWIYFIKTNRKAGYSICRIRVDGSQGEMVKKIEGKEFGVNGTKVVNYESFLIDKNFMYINLYFLYTDSSKNYRSFYSMSLDGSEVQEIPHEEFSRLYSIVNDKIYFLNYIPSESEEGNGIYSLHCMNLDGSNNAKITSYNSGSFYDFTTNYVVTNEWIFKYDYAGDNSTVISRMNIDGTDETKIIEVEKQEWEYIPESNSWVVKK